MGLAVGFGFQGSRGLFETTEGRYAEVAREMVESGDFLEPTLDQTPHWTKPPAAYWGIAAGVALLGDNAWGARLSHAIELILTAAVVLLIGRALYDPGTGLLAGLVYATSLLPAAGAAAISADMPLALVEALAVLCWARAIRAGTTRRGAAWVAAMWAAFGAAFLVKGPAGLLPLLPIVVFHVRLRSRANAGEGAGGVPSLASAAGIGLAAVVGLWWYVLVSLRHDGLLHYFVMEEVVARNVTATANRNPEWYGPVAIYLPVLLLAPGPWIWQAWRGARSWWVDGRGGGRPAPGLRRVADTLLRGRGPGAFLALWLALPLGVFALSRSRLPLYLLPLYPAIAIAIARLAIRRSGTARALRVGVRTAIAGAAAIVLVKGVLARVPDGNDMRRLSRAIEAAAPPCAEPWILDEPRLYGLQFYLGGSLRRVSSGGLEPWASATLEQLAADQRRSRNPVLIVAGDGDASSIRAAAAPERVERVALGYGRSAYVLPADRGGTRCDARPPVQSPV